MTYARDGLAVRLPTTLALRASSPPNATVALVSLTSFRRGFRFALAILAQGSTDIVALAELSFCITPHEAFVAFVRLDQLSFPGHFISLLKAFEKSIRRAIS
jgi:hypothetical protein